MEALKYIAALIGSMILVYMIARLVFSAFFASKLDHMKDLAKLYSQINKESRNEENKKQEV